VRRLLDQGAATNQRGGAYPGGQTALWCACSGGHPSSVGLLLERGADPTTANDRGSTPLLTASRRGRLEVVRLLLAHPSAKSTVNHRDGEGATALWWACKCGRGGVVRALLEGGADPTTAHSDGTTPTALAKQEPPPGRGVTTAEGRRECVAALEVRLYTLFFPSPKGLLFTSACLRQSGVFFVFAGGGAGLPAVEGPAGGRPAGERRGGGGGGARGGEGAVGLCGA
jgi:hypothetical protein